MIKDFRHIYYGTLIIGLLALHDRQIEAAQSFDQKKVEQCLCQDCTIASSPTKSHPYTQEEATLAAALTLLPFAGNQRLRKIFLHYYSDEGQWLTMPDFERSCWEKPYIVRGCLNPLFRLDHMVPYMHIWHHPYPDYTVEPLIDGKSEVEFTLGDAKKLQDFLSAEGQDELKNECVIISICKKYKVIAQSQSSDNWINTTTTLTRQCYLNSHARILELLQHQ